MRKKISIVTPCFNEEGNVELLCQRVKNIFEQFPHYDYEHIFIDNASADKTASIIKNIIDKDKNVKLIVNTRNFGHIRSPFYGLLQATGDAAVLIAADFQDPPELIYDFLKKWEDGYKVVAAIKNRSDESPLLFFIRKLYYKICRKMSEAALIDNFTGFGLYDKSVIKIFRNIGDNYPYLRGLVSEIGFDVAPVYFQQPKRKTGKSKNNFFSLLDMAILGITSHSKIPIRIATIFGFAASLMSIILALIFFVLKLLFWNSFQLGMAPLLISMFFYFSLQLFFGGLLGEYVVSIHTRILNRPIITEKERINFPKNNFEEK